AEDVGEPSRREAVRLRLLRLRHEAVDGPGRAADVADTDADAHAGLSRPDFGRPEARADRHATFTGVGIRSSRGAGKRPRVASDPVLTIACPRCVWSRTAIGRDASLLLQLALRVHYEVFHPRTDPSEEATVGASSPIGRGATRVAVRGGRRAV